MTSPTQPPPFNLTTGQAAPGFGGAQGYGVAGGYGSPSGYADLLASQQQTQTSQQLAQLASNYQVGQGQLQGKPLQKLVHQNSFFDDPLGWIGSKSYELYSTVISRPLTTVMLMPDITSAASLKSGDQSFAGNFQQLFNGANWDRAFADARHVSPGQVFSKDVASLFTGSVTSQNALEHTLNYRSDGSIIWDHPDEVANYFNHGLQMYASGGLDAAFSWRLDPLALAGKGIGAISKASIIRPSIETAPTKFIGVGGKGGNLTIKLVGKATGATPEAIAQAQADWRANLTTDRLQQNLDSSRFNQFGNFLESQRNKLQDQFPAWVVRQGWASGGGGTLGAAFGAAKNRDDIDTVLRVAMGDKNAYSGLMEKNADLAADLQNLTGAPSVVPKNIFGNGPNAQAAHSLITTMLTDQRQKLEGQIGDIQKTLDAADLMSNRAIRFNVNTSPFANAAKQWARGVDYRTLRGSGVRAFMPNVVYNGAYVAPVRLFSGQVWSDLHPNGWINFEDPNSWQEVDAEIQRSGLYSLDERQKMVSSFITAPRNMKQQVLGGIEASMTSGLASKYGLTDDTAKVLYDHFNQRRAQMMNQAFSSGKVTLEDGREIDIDGRYSAEGGLTGRAPIFQSQLANHHVMMDVDNMDKVLKNNARAFSNLLENPSYNSLGGKLSVEQAAAAVSAPFRPGALRTQVPAAIDHLNDIFNSAWKANVLFRLGYGMRAISDDMLGQVARLGPWDMMSNMFQGMRGQAARAQNRVGRVFSGVTPYDVEIARHQNNVNGQQWIIDDIQDSIKNWQNRTYKSARGQAMQSDTIAQYQKQLDKANSDMEFLKQQSATIANRMAKTHEKQWIMPNGQVSPAFSAGADGALQLKLNEGARGALDWAVGGAASAKLGHMRGLNWGAVRPDDPGYNESWLRVIQGQMGHSDLLRQIAGNKMSIDDVVKYLRTPEGTNYYKSLVHSNMDRQELAERTVAAVNHVLPEHDDNYVALRQAFANGASDGQIRNAIRAVGNHPARPVINGEQVAYSLGHSSVGRALDKGINTFYKLFAELPTNVLSRNPLAATLYRNYLEQQWKLYGDAGFTHLSSEQMEQASRQARRLTVQDVKRFTYNMDHETKLTHMMRFAAPFFGPMQEPINRWSRILADRPDVAGKFNMIYNSPIRTGHMVDKNGQTIDSDGYSIDPASGQKYLVPKSEMNIQFHMPDFMAKALGLNTNNPVVIPTTGGMAQLKIPVTIPMSTLPLPFRNDPWYNPGEGPLVEMAANGWAKEDPTVGDRLTNLGILPQGVQQSALNLFLGGTIKNALAEDDPHTVNSIALQIMNEDNYRYRNGLQKDQPSFPDALKKAQHFLDLEWWMKLGGAIPVSFKINDPYKFFSDQYRVMSEASPLTARQQFLNKYGSSAYAFTQSIMKNNEPGVGATLDAFNASSRMQGLINQYPQFAAMILGADSNSGQYSPTVDKLQQWSGQRTLMTPQEAFTQGQVSLGWDNYSKQMNYLIAQLKARGLSSFQQKGAEDLLQQKQAYVQLSSMEKTTDGKMNPLYNPDWLKAYYSSDPYAGNQKAAQLEQIAASPDLQGRADIQGLGLYLQDRAAVQQVMAQRQGSQIDTKTGQPKIGPLNINSTANKDLKAWFQQNIINLIEANPQFQTLHDTFLANDMFDHYSGTDLSNTVYGGG